MTTAKMPRWSLGELRALAKHGMVRPTKESERFLVSYYDADPKEVIAAVMGQMTDDDFVRSYELVGRPGTMADVYVGGSYGESEWYVKALIEDDALSLQMRSMALDGLR